MIKKRFLSLGVIGVLTPIATTISCSQEIKEISTIKTALFETVNLNNFVSWEVGTNQKRTIYYLHGTLDIIGEEKLVISNERLKNGGKKLFVKTYVITHETYKMLGGDE